MNDSGLLSELIEKFNTASGLLKTIAVFVAVNIIASVINGFFQYKIMTGQSKVHKRNIQEDKRINIIDELYQKLNKLMDIPPHDTQILLTQITQVREFINKNGLFLSEGETNIANNCCDYFSLILTSVRNKDLKKEKEFLTELKRLFNA